MFKRKFFRSYTLRFVIETLFWTAVLVGLAYLAFQRVWWMERLRFGDVLFVLGLILVTAASLGMMSRPYGVAGMGIPAMPVRTSEEEKGFRILEDLLKARSFAARLIVIGLLIILVSLAFTYWIH
jgi:hypothetical protein